MNRSQAEKLYKAALKAEQLASCGTDLAAYEAANETLSLARRALVQAELAEPTKQETRKQDKLLQLRNRGLDA